MDKCRSQDNPRTEIADKEISDFGNFQLGICLRNDRKEGAKGRGKQDHKDSRNTDTNRASVSVPSQGEVTDDLIGVGRREIHLGRIEGVHGGR